MGEQFIADIKSLSGLIKDNWSLCNFLGKFEKEYMVAETIHAANLNLRAYGEPFSIRGAGVFRDAGHGLVENASSYRALRADGLFREEERELAGHGRVTVIFPTPELIERLKQFFSEQAARPA